MGPVPVFLCGDPLGCVVPPLYNGVFSLNCGLGKSVEACRDTRIAMIEIRDFSFTYRESKEPTVRDVNLTIPDGTFVGITGAAGSGKSTLTYALNGIIPHCYPGEFFGSVLIDGLDTVETSLTDISRLVGSVCQDIDSQMVSSVVDDELLYGLENFGIPHDEIPGRVDEALEAMGILDLKDCAIDSLSGGQKQKVAIAAIVALRPRILVLDEPTAELDPASSVAVFDLLRRYAQSHGTTVIVVEQKIALLSDFADMLVIVDDGRLRFVGSPSEVLAHSDELLEIGVACPRSTSLANRLRSAGLYYGGRGAGMIEFRDVHASYDGERAVLKGVDFTIGDGEFVSFVGTNGAGKSTTMRLMNGLLKPTRGDVLIDGVSTRDLKTSQLARSVGFLFQNPDRQICNNTVREELLFGFKALGEKGPEVEARVDAIIAELGFDPEADPFLLNRGTRQLLALASIVVVEPSVVVLDEPTTGLDYRECSKVMDIVSRLHEQGTTVVMVCHDMEVVGDYARRVIVMNDGRVIDDGPTFEVLRRPETVRRASLVPPQIVGISMELVRRYPSLAQTPIATANTLEEMASAIELVRSEGGEL